MPIDRDRFHIDMNAARAWLQSRDGSILHEVAHYSAANADQLIAGHLIIPDDQNAVGNAFKGAFAIDHDTYEALVRGKNLEQQILSAAALAELHFCNNTEFSRCRFDIEQYTGKQIKRGREFSELRNSVELWRRVHERRIRVLYPNMERNYDAVRDLVASGDFLIGQWHVIPSSQLTPNCTFAEVERGAERQATDSQESRENVLQRLGLWQRPSVIQRILAQLRRVLAQLRRRR